MGADDSLIKPAQGIFPIFTGLEIEKAHFFG
jgi:hypothetical protein